MKSCQTPFELLLDYQEGRVDAETAARLRRHLESGCVECQREQEWIATFLPALQRTLREGEVQVSESALAFARSLMTPVRPEASRPSPLVQWARLIFDSRFSAAPLAAAREVASPSIHSIFRAEEIDIDVWQEQASGRGWVLIGQALPADGEALSPQRVTLLSSEGATRDAIIEDDEFMFEAVSAGPYTLRLRLEDQEILVSDLMVGAEAQP